MYVVGMWHTFIASVRGHLRRAASLAEFDRLVGLTAVFYHVTTLDHGQRAD